MASSGLLRLQSVTVFVKDQDESIGFYVDRLGFRLIADAPLPDGKRWVAVGPPDGDAILGLIAPTPESEQYKLIGRDTDVIFLAEDVRGKLEEWENRGVRIRETSSLPSWSGTFATFEDLDGKFVWRGGL